MTKNCVNGGDIRLHYLITLERFEALHDKACWRIRRSCVLENEWDLVWKVRKGCQRGRYRAPSRRTSRNKGHRMTAADLLHYRQGLLKVLGMVHDHDTRAPGQVRQRPR